MRFLALCLCLLTPMSAVAQDDDDRGYIQGLLEDALSGPGRTVIIDGFAGALSSRATIEKITVTDEQGVWVTAEDIAMVWTRTALLRGRIKIDEISIGRIDLPRKPLPSKTELPSAASGEAFSLPSLPVSVNIDKMDIKDVLLGESLFGQSARVSFSGSARLEDGAGDVDLNMVRTDAEGELRLKGSFNNESRVLGLDLALIEPQDGIAANLLSLPGKPSLELTVKGEDPLSDFNASILLATDNQERLSGVVTLISQSDGTNRFAALLGGDIAPVFVPEFAEFLGNKVDLTAAGHQAPDGTLTLDALRVSAAALLLDGSAEISPDGWPRKLSLDGNITPPAGETVILPLSGPKIEIRSAVLSGSFDSASGEEWSLNGQLLGFEQETLALDSVGFEASGVINRTEERIDGELTLDATGLAPASQDLAEAIGDSLNGALAFDWAKGAPFTLNNLKLSGKDYGLTGSLVVSDPTKPDELSLTPDFTLAARDLSRFAKLATIPLAGAADLKISGLVAPLTGAFDLSIFGSTQDLKTGVAELDPLLTGQGLLAVNATRGPDGFVVKPLTIETSQINLVASGTLKETGSTGTLSARLVDLGKAIPQVRGPAAITADAVQVDGGWDVTALTTLPGDARATFTGELRETQPAKWQASGSLDARIGQLAKYADLAGQPLAGSASLKALGSANFDTTEFDLNADAQLDNFKFGNPQVETLLRGATTAKLSASGNLDDIDISTLNLKASGVSAEISGQIGPDSGDLRYQLDMANLALIVPDFPGAVSASGTANKQGDTWQINTSGEGPGGIRLTASGDIAQDVSTMNLAVSGAAPLEAANIYLTGQALSGQVGFDLQVNGPPALNSVSGRFTLSEANFTSPALGVALNDIRGGADLAAGRATLGLSGQVASGGQVQVSGPITLEAPFNADLTVILDKITLREASLFEVALQGNLRVTGGLAGGAGVTGSIDLTDAEIQLPPLSSSYSALDGLRHLHPSKKVKRTLRYAGLESVPTPKPASTADYPLDVTINAPNQIFIRGRGLDAELNGSLRITGSSNNIQPIGAFNLVRGRLSLLGRRLDLNEGLARLEGSFDPVIDFSATSEVEDVSITLRISGLASEPELEVTSDPDMPDDEALSYFLFGKDPTNISALQAIQLAAAIRTLSGQGGVGLTDQLRQTLNVDELDIGLDADGNAEAKVGKYISESIYTDLTVNSDGTNEVSLNLDVTPNLTVRGSADNDGDSSIGIFFERDY